LGAERVQTGKEGRLDLPGLRRVTDVILRMNCYVNRSVMFVLFFYIMYQSRRCNAEILVRLESIIFSFDLLVSVLCTLNNKSTTM